MRVRKGEGDATFLESDELAESGKVMSAGLVGDVMGGDVDDGQRLLHLALVVGKPSESGDDVFDFGSEEDGGGFAIAAAGKDAVVTVAESDFELIDEAIGEVTEAKDALSGAFTEMLLEGEGAGGGFQDPASSSGIAEVKAASDFGVRASLGEDLDSLGLDIFWDAVDFEIPSHGGGLYHGFAAERSLSEKLTGASVFRGHEKSGGASRNAGRLGDIS